VVLVVAAAVAGLLLFGAIVVDFMVNVLAVLPSWADAVRDCQRR
jgi:hypothetical protein